ncbi:hypothetical protein AXW67_02780 [Bradyrhizobium neotropicale]|uniref:Anti-sigma factor NepR domain-containing protein n=2 Tax=Bradyrhizobium neotropicale TaxID=1497615 RepID=A0A176ZD43_9BRAD|nr:hypothetical protein AXW67_02780 [Bradyrhizobium neotropicale]
MPSGAELLRSAGLGVGTMMLDDEFNRQRAKILRDLAEQADPFIRRRLLLLVERYEPAPPPAPNDPQPARPRKRR